MNSFTSLHLNLYNLKKSSAFLFPVNGNTIFYIIIYYYNQLLLILDMLFHLNHF